MDVTALTSIAIGLALAMAAAWLIHRLSGKSGWIDAVWSFAVGAGGVAAALMPSPSAIEGRKVTVAVLIALWALRLGLHIVARTRKGDDDPRYADLMKQWGKKAALNLFIFLEIQAACALVLVVAVRLAASNPAPFPAITDYAGIVLLLIAVVGEAIADAQLRAFGRTHPRSVCDVGLWRYSRHPNYFFEWLGWCAWAVMAANTAHPWGWAALGAPVLMYVLLVHVSGIPPLEAHMRASRGAKFDAYAAKTSAFFPLPNRKVPA